MLLNSHYLYAVISLLYNTWKDVFFEFGISTHFLCILCHTNVALIDKERCRIRLEGLFLPLIFFFRCPHLCREYLCLIILYHTTNPCRNTLSLTTRPLYEHLVEITMFQSCLWKFYLPILSVLTLLKSILRCFLPFVKIANEVYFCGIWSPLTEYPFTLLVAMQTVIEITSCKIRQLHFSAISEMIYHPQSVIMTTLNSILEWLQPRIIGNDANMFWSIFFHDTLFYILVFSFNILHFHLEDSLLKFRST